MIYAINTLVACCFTKLVKFILTLISEIYKNNNRYCGANNIESSSFQQKLTAELGKTGSAKFFY